MTLISLFLNIFKITYLKTFYFTLTSLDISDVDPVWTWGDKRPPPTKKQKKLVILKKKLVTEI